MEDGSDVGQFHDLLGNIKTSTNRIVNAPKLQNNRARRLLQILCPDKVRGVGRHTVFGRVKYLLVNCAF
jgi:hypothetical protein